MFLHPIRCNCCIFFFCFWSRLPQFSIFSPIRFSRLRSAASENGGRAIFHLVRKCDECKNYRVRGSNEGPKFPGLVLPFRVRCLQLPSHACRTGFQRGCYATYVVNSSRSVYFLVLSCGVPAGLLDGAALVAELAALTRHDPNLSDAQSKVCLFYARQSQRLNRNLRSSSTRRHTQEVACACLDVETPFGPVFLTHSATPQAVLQ